MAQHARPIGPTTANAAAAFSPEMVAGAAPDRSPMLGWRRQVGHSVSQPTHVAAAVTSSMTQGTPGAKGPNPAQPDLHTSTTPPDVIVFSIDMVVGARPDRARLFLPLRTGWQVDTAEQLAASFSIEMLLADRPTRPRLYRPPQGLIAYTPDTVAFPMETVYGSMPSRPRVFSSLLSRGETLAQPTHVQAPFSVEMAVGAHPDRNREFLPVRTGLVAQTADGAPFSVEMAIGSHPDSPRLFTVIPHLGTFAIQPVQLAAPFTSDMVQGSAPDRKREVLPLRTGQTLWISDVVILTPDMTQGSQPPRPRLTSAQQPGPVVPPSVDPFSNDMVIGSQPSRAQLARAREGLVIAAPTVIPFSNEMVVGWHPDQPRLFYPLRILGVTDPSSAPHVAAPFSIDMVTGWTPARSRQGTPLRYLQGPTWYWPTDATTGPLIVMLFAQRMAGPMVIGQAMATPLTRRQEDL